MSIWSSAICDWFDVLKLLCHAWNQGTRKIFRQRACCSLLHHQILRTLGQLAHIIGMIDNAITNAGKVGFTCEYKLYMLYDWKVQNHVEAITKNPSVYAIVHNLCVQLQLSVHSSITRTLINYTINWCSDLHCATKTLPKPASNSCYLNRTIISESEYSAEYAGETFPMQIMFDKNQHFTRQKLSVGNYSAAIRKYRRRTEKAHWSKLDHRRQQAVSVHPGRGPYCPFTSSSFVTREQFVIIEQSKLCGVPFGVPAQDISTGRVVGGDSPVQDQKRIIINKSHERALF